MPPVGAVHLVPQAPQLLTSEAVETQAEPQRVPEVQVGLQTPALQEVVPPVGAVHVIPQPPQLLTSLVVVTQTLLQFTWPDAQQTPPGQATQSPPLHWLPLAQPVLLVQVVVQAFVPQMNGVQAFVAGVTQVPLPLQVDAGCAVPAVHEAAPQLVPETVFRQAPAPLHVPSRPQGATLVQRVSAPPVEIGAQVPLAWPVRALLQAMQVPQLALAQQTLSTHEPVAHCRPLEQVWPLFRRQVLLVQVWVAPQVVPQAPQFGLAVRLTQVPPQLTNPDAQQRPERQVEPVAQALVQLPQCALLLVRSKQTLLQAVCPVVQTTSSMAPALIQPHTAATARELGMSFGCTSSGISRRPLPRWPNQ